MEKKKSSNNFEDLFVWQKAHEFVLMAYSATKNFPKEELFCLTSQFRRAAISITANIAEGYKRTGHNDKLRFYNISQGSIEECRNYIILSKDLGYFNLDIKNNLLKILQEASYLLNTYCKSLISNVSKNNLKQPITSP